MRPLQRFAHKSFPLRIRHGWILVTLLLAGPLAAQRSASSLTGIVTDPTGSGVNAAEVLAIHRATAVEHRTATNDEGVFTFPSLRPGNYDVRIEATGFKRFESREVIVEAAKTVRLDARLEVGTVQESVTVTAELPLLERESSGQSSQVGRQLIERLPFQLSGAMRDINSVIRLVPGVRLHLNNFGYNITGGRQLGSEVLIDGVPNMYRASFNVPFNVRPALDTVGEFRVEAAVPNAEFGRTSSGVVVFQTRSGTNEFHGAAEFLLRNNVLDARRFNAARADTTRQGEAGVTVSGPVRLPGYDGRNRTFFLANVTGFRRLNQPQGVVRTLPTGPMRNGDFSASPQVIYDPASAAQASARTPFPGNQIPAARISRFALGMLNVIPLPNLPTLESNFIGNQNQIENTNVYYLKADHNLTARQRLTASARVTRQERNNDNSPYGGRLEGFQDFPNTWHAVAHYDFVARPNLLNRVSYGYTSWYSDFRNTPGSPYPVPNAYGPGFSVLLFQSQGLSRIGENLDRNVRARNTHLQNSLSWTRGRHNWKFGFRFDYFEDDQENIGNRNGTYTFSQFASGAPGNTRAGHAFASFLLGRPQTAGMQYGLPMLGWSRYWAFYAQDDWKVTPRLTLNYGLRYEWQTPFADRQSNQSSFDPDVPNPGAAGFPGALVFAGHGPGRSGRDSLINVYRQGFGPRLGLAWEAAPNTILRAGAGVFYAPRIYLQYGTQGFSANVTVSSQDGGFSPPFLIDSGWPAGLAVLPPFINPAFANNQAVVHTDPDANHGSGRQARTMQYHAGVQHRLRTLLFEASYVATLAHGIPNATLANWNQVDPRYLSLGALLRNNILSAEVAAAGFRPPYAGFNGTLAQALRPFPQYQTITSIDSPTGKAAYHGFLLKIEQRFSNDLTLLAAYTFSKSISDVESTQNANQLLQNAFDRRSERSVTAVDLPHNLVTSFSYVFPAGKGRRYFNRGPAAALLGGWALSGVLTYRSGFPLRLTIPNSLPLFNGVLRPNLVAGEELRSGGGRGSFEPTNQVTGQPGDVYINRAAFATPAPFTFGNLAQFLPWLRDFGLVNEDLSLSKSFTLRERARFELRTDWFNAFNRRNLNAPVTDLTSVNFGRILSQQPARAIQLGARFEF